MQRIKGLLLLLGTVLLVFFITREIYQPGAVTEQVSAAVLLERVRPVLKLTTVEGEFVELYTHKDSWDWGYSIPGFTEKRAILRVKARVSVGYDLNGMRVSTNEVTHTITLDAPPRPQILSVEHDIDYYDMSEGLFNSFGPQELTSISARAKQQVLDKVPQSGLFEEAEKQRDEVVGVVRTLAESAGWTVEVNRVEKPATPVKD